VGQNAPIIFDLGPVVSVKIGNKWFVSALIDTFGVTSTQIQQLLAGKWYVDVHTQNKPNGEIRGQITAVRGNGFAALQNRPNLRNGVGFDDFILNFTVAMIGPVRKRSDWFEDQIKINV